MLWVKHQAIKRGIAMGYLRSPSAAVRSHAAGAPLVRLVTPADLAQVMREQDPFGIALSCTNPAGHQPIASCGEIVCCHCARIFWR
jgi:hypothetical protein